MSVLPDKPRDRAAIIVLSDADFDACQYDTEAASLMDQPGVHVLALRDVDEAPLVASMADRGLVRPGSVLVQSPFDTEMYADSEEAEEVFGIAKHLVFCELAQVLGARRVTVHQVEKLEGSTKTTVKVDAKAGPVKADGSVVSSDLEKLAQGVRLEQRWKGGEADIQAAYTLIAKARLSHEPVMSSLVRSRMVAANPLEHMEYALDLTAECQRCLSVVARLKAPPGVGAGLGVKFDRVRKSKATYRLVVAVDF